MSHGSHSHGGMNEHSTMATQMHHSMEHQGGHSSHGNNGETAGHVMMFHLRSDLNLLFEPWDISSTKVLVGSCIAVLFVSLLYEGLKIFRARLIGMRNRLAKHGCWANICSAHHLSQTIMHVVQVVVGYLLMLVVMTYQVYLGIAVIIGAGLGYFFFAGFIGNIVPTMPPTCEKPTPASPALILNVTNFKDIEKNEHQPEKLSLSDLAIENKGFDLETNDADDDSAQKS